MAEEIRAMFEDAENVDAAKKACNYVRRMALSSKASSNDFRETPTFLCKVIRDYLDDVSAQKCATVAVAAIAEKKGIFAEISDLGILSDLCRIWSLHLRNRSYVKDVLVLLRTLATDEDLRLVIATGDALTLIVSSMNQYCDDETVQLHALAVLVNVSYGTSVVKGRVFAVGGLTAVIRAMQTFSGARHGKIQLKGCSAVRNLSVGLGDFEIVFFGADVIECIKRAVTDFRCSSDVLSQALTALANIYLARGPSSGPCEKQEEVLKALMQILTRSSGSVRNFYDIYELVFKLLRLMALNSSIAQETAARLGFVQTTLNMLQGFMTGAEGVTLSDSRYSVTAHAISALRCLTRCHHARERIVCAENGLLVLVNCVSFFKQDVANVEHAILALANTLYDSQEAKAGLAEHEGLKLLIQVMNQHTSCAAVQEACCLALRAACDGYAENQQKAFRLGCQRSSLAVVENFCENVVLLEQAFALLLTVLQDCQQVSDDDAARIAHAINHAVSKYPCSTLLKAQRALLLKAVDRNPNGGEVADPENKLRAAFQRTLKRFGSRS